MTRSKPSFASTLSRRIAWLVALGLVTACAGASIKNTQRYVDDHEVVRPTQLLIYDFAVSANEVRTKGLLSGYSSGPEQTVKQSEEGHKIAASLSQQLVEQLAQRGVRARRATWSEYPPLDAILIEGQFVSIDKGSTVMRTVVGFGAGASKIQTVVQVSQITEQGPMRIAKAEVDAHGNRKPGMAVPVAGGAAVGGVAVSAAVSGGMAIISETMSSMEKNAGNIAKQIAERVADFYAKRGWL